MSETTRAAVCDVIGSMHAMQTTGEVATGQIHL